MRLRSIFDDYRIKMIAFDRWNFQHFRPCLARAGFSESRIAEPFVEFGQGYQSMSPAIRDTEALILNRKLRHNNHPVLNMCAANSVIESDAAGNRKLTKKRSRGRIDGMVALVMAIGVAPAAWVAKPLAVVRRRPRRRQSVEDGNTLRLFRSLRRPFTFGVGQAFSQARVKGLCRSSTGFGRAEVGPGPHLQPLFTAMRLT
jgi:hypothetical protein